MPRDDLSRLGIRHRRIPILAIGNDVYLDTRLILHKLELIKSKSPSVRPPLGLSYGIGGKPASAEELALERLLSVFSVDSGLFIEAARLIPAGTAAMKDPVFGKDRMDFFGGPLNPRTKTSSSSAASPQSPAAIAAAEGPAEPPASQALLRAEALAEVRHFATILETTLLADGRQWILNTENPSLSDIDAIWPFHWLHSMPGAFLDGSGSEKPGLDALQFPKLFAWIDRFHNVIRTARKSQNGQSSKITGAEAAKAVQTAEPWDAMTRVASYIDISDPVAQVASLTIGRRVVLWPTDTGKEHRDEGEIIRFEANEVAIKVKPSEDAPHVILHAPRHGFRVRPVEGTDGPRL
ncbi:hypothetical protein Sste5346_002748 [Sporothrix stenoceras]|uniref:DUF7962 domain-containing protein n=1 Tax=Sporothrix stenoceras TaxID=5173 RepID=A0ABR3ZI60_9PEZI